MGILGAGDAPANLADKEVWRCDSETCGRGDGAGCCCACGDRDDGNKEDPYVHEARCHRHRPVELEDAATPVMTHGLTVVAIAMVEDVREGTCIQYVFSVLANTGRVACFL
jgi:hypothetical protein